MKQLFLIWFVFGVCTSVHSQIVTVFDRETGKPLEMVTLIGENRTIYAITNTNGEADFSAFGGAEQIQISSLGYKKRVLSHGEIVSLDYKIGLAPSNLNLDEVVVSGSRWQQRSSDIPSKIVTITPQEVALQNPQTAADLLGSSGKVFVQKSQQGGGSPMIRGFATNRLLYTIDGVRMNTAIFRGGNIQNVLNLDPFAVGSTEVLFGPGSVIYGSDAIGGVMAFQTLRPQLSLNDSPLITGKAVTRYSSANNEQTAHFDVNVGWKKWAMLTSFSTWDFDHLKQGSHGPDEYIRPFYVQRQDGVDRIIEQEDPLEQIPTAYSQINLTQKIRFKPNKNWDLQYGLHFSETSSYGRYDRHNRMRNGTARYAQWDYGPQLWVMNNLTVSHTGKNAVYDQMSLRLAQQTFEESRIDRSLNDSERNVQTEKVNAYSVNLDLTRFLKGDHTLFYGLEFIHNDVESNGELTDITTDISQRGPSRYPQSTWSSMAVYVNDEYRATDDLTLQMGLRYNLYRLDADFDTTFYPFPFTEATIDNGAVTGSIGMVYRPVPSWVLSSNFGTAFRSPNVDDVGKVFDSEPGAVTVPNPDLEAEYAYNIDVGIAKVFGDIIKLDVTGYYTLLDNALVRRDFTLNGEDTIIYDGEPSRVQAIQNAAEAHVWGIQAGLEAKLPQGFRFSTDLNYQKGEEELDDGSSSPLRHAAPLFGATRLSYNANDLQLQLYATYQGEMEFDELALEEQGKDEIYAKDGEGRNFSPSWYTINLKSTYPLTEVLTVSAGLENITDQRYRPYSAGVSAPGRNFVISLSAYF